MAVTDAGSDQKQTIKTDCQPGSPGIMDTVLEQLHTLASHVDSVGRYKLLDFIRDLQLELETPLDMLSRFSGMHLEISVARIGEDLEIFRILAESEQPLSVAELAAKTSSAPSLLAGMIRETGPGIFTANAITKTLAQAAYRGGIYHYFNNVGPTLQILPDFLAENKYDDINDQNRLAFHKAFSTDLPPFKWMSSQPDRFGPFQQTMTVQGAASMPWFSVFPLEKEIGAFSGTHVLVDVGGGFGHQCAALLAAFPQLLRGKLVLQDLPQALEKVPLSLDGIEPMAHNFFHPQPVKGARFYYLRHILHDWPDDKCVAILQQLIPALGPESQILIDESVLPNEGVSREAATLDLLMMASLGARERTVAEWHALLDAAGLRVQRIDTYMPRRQDSIIQAVPK
ncbi:hypothetical protein AAE478_010197 [Parahypoxylon ruwenzoriense]